MRRIGIVGLGSIGRRHARLLSARPDVELHVTDLSPAGRDLARSECGAGLAATHASLDALLAAGPEAVVIATPHHLHVPQTRAALAAGCHVLCEKPVSHSLEEARSLRDNPLRQNRVLSFGFHLHFHPALTRLKRMIVAGELGQFVYLGCHVGSYQTLQFSASRYQKDTFGALLLDYVHQPDLVCWLSGRRPLSVAATGLRQDYRELSSDPSLISILYDFGGGFAAHVHQNYLEHPEVHSYHAVFSAGSVLIDLPRGLFRIHDGESIRDESFEADRDAVYRAEHQAFFDAIDGRRLPESPIEEAILSLELQHAALNSLVRSTVEPVSLDGRVRGTRIAAGQGAD